MSQHNKRQRGLSQDELELHAILDSPSGSLTTATASPPKENEQNYNVAKNNNENRSRKVQKIQI